MTDELKVPFGKRADGTIVHITELTSDENGLRCGCTCPKCGTPLQARNMGKLRVHHFSHNVRTSCEGAVESALHQFAKEVFSRHTSIRVPEETTYVGSHSALVTEALNVPYTAVAIEQRAGDVIPDVTLERAANKPPLLVEVAVTHFADEDKCAKLESLGYPCIEVDLHDMASLEEFDREAVEKALVSEDDRKIWLFHPLEPQARAQLEADLQEAEEKRAQELHEAWERRQRSAERKRQERARVLAPEYQQEMNERRARELPTHPIWVANKHALGIPDNAETPWYLDCEIEGEYLWTVHRSVWQSALFLTWVFNKSEDSRSRFVSVKYALETLHERYPSIWEPGLYWAWKDLPLDCTIVTPATAVGHYLSVLARCGFLWADKNIGEPYSWTFSCVRPELVLLPAEYNSPRYVPSKYGVRDTEEGEYCRAKTTVRRLQSGPAQ